MISKVCRKCSNIKDYKVFIRIRNGDEYISKLCNEYHSCYQPRPRKKIRRHKKRRENIIKSLQ